MTPQNQREKLSKEEHHRETEKQMESNSKPVVYFALKPQEDNPLGGFSPTMIRPLPAWQHIISQAGEFGAEAVACSTTVGNK